MRTNRYCTLRAALVAAMIIAVWSVPSGAAERNQGELIGVLRSDAPPADKAMACKQLAICGGKDAVPALAPLLASDELASWARIALEAIPDPAAGEALRGAMGKLRGRLLVGAINSLGVRRDAQAASDLVARLKDTDADVTSAAAAALGRIGNAAAVSALEQSLPVAPAAVRSAVAEGCILCAERLAAAGKSPEAVKLYDLVRKADVPRQRIVEATRGAILARQSAGVPLLVEQLRSDDKALLAIGLRTARELAGSEVTAALLTELATAKPDRQHLVLLALADRGDAAALPAVLQAAKTGSDETRLWAMRAMKRLGNASCVPVLLEAAMDADEARSQTAAYVLADLPGKDVDDDLVGRLAKANGKARQVLIEAAGRRHVVAAVPTLLKAADETDGQVRAAALTALGLTIDFADLPVLIARVVNPPAKPEEAKAAEDALRAACQRMPDRDACVAKLLAAVEQAATPAKCKVLQITSVVGGAKALKAVEAAAKGADPELQDAASRLFGEWMTLDAAPVLLDLAQTASDTKYQTRAMRGYIRQARQFFMPEQDRIAMCRAALQAAKRDAEKKLVLEVLERYPSREGLNMAVEAAKIPALKNDAARACLVIAEKIGGHGPEIQKMLALVGHEPVKVEIVKADYGEGTKVKDVTEVLKRHARDFPLVVLPTASYNASFGGDPSPGVVKQLKVRYRINGKDGEASFAENATILLPVPK